ncbi:DUF4012 domain-containing protein [Arthrobacter sp. STN4]|uniref:DUF4012 domain-containing protein n=1 Tax=Arthrobacter sp. STN4 TaxID=2923276 RepID=UPI002119C73B|nr:DUF4012 domain-containing protein [Arthrobacter sp. STN4]MCQ9163657.1 DUF4012 domain-containing protein [Arthrobacter sp. STN4]
MKHPAESSSRVRRSVQPSAGRRRRKRNLQIGVALLALVVIAGGTTAWLGFRAGQIKDNLAATTHLLPQLKSQILANDPKLAAATVASLAERTSAAKRAATDPVWKLASGLPWIGPNLAAASEAATTADDVVRLAAQPLVGAFESLDWKALTPVKGAVQLARLQKAAPNVVAAANSVELSYERLAAIDAGPLMPQVAGPLGTAKKQLNELRGALSVASGAVQLVPAMMGADGPRNYLLLIQNNAEVRASGGIPGALAVIHVDKGKMQLTQQDSASALGLFDPAIKVDAAQEAIYSNRMGSYMQDVNMTPDFPTAASTARAMWVQRHPGQKIDGVVSIDPVALSYVLKATGPVDIKLPVSADVAQESGLGALPTHLTSENLVPVLLSDVYAKVKEPALQDVYFAAVAKQVFEKLSAGNTSGEKLVQALGTGVAENRILLWSTHSDDQTILETQRIGGTISGPAVPAAAFGVYFNDGTGAKMDYYVKRTVQLVQKCTAGGYGEYTAKISLTNTAPGSAATALPEYVTGGGVYGISPGHVATNVIAYGPSQARAQAVRVDGKTTGFGSFSQDERPVGVVRVELAPGQTTTVEIDFSKVVQTSAAQLEVTPTIQKTSDVILPLHKDAGCTPAVP